MIFSFVEIVDVANSSANVETHSHLSLQIGINDRNKQVSS